MLRIPCPVCGTRDETEFSFEGLPSKPKKVTFDPGERVLLRFRKPLGTEELRRPELVPRLLARNAALR